MLLEHKLIADLGLKILVTEMDVLDRSFPTDSMVRDRIVAETYENYLSVVLDEPAVIAVVTWGLSDRYTWLLKEKRTRADKSPVRPLPFDAELRPKLAYNAITRAFEKAPMRKYSLYYLNNKPPLEMLKYLNGICQPKDINSWSSGTRISR